MKNFLTKVALGIFIGASLCAGFYIATKSDLPEQQAVSVKEERLDVKKEAALWTFEILDLGGEAAYEKFVNTYKEGYSTGQKHERAHVMGEVLYKVLGIPGLVVCDEQFSFGCYHSFFGFAITTNGLSILEKLDQACIDEYGSDGGGCPHGIGHGVITELGHENLGQALVECMRLDWQEPIGGCTSGVFMEYNHHTMADGKTRKLVGSDEHYPCNEVADKFVEACYFDQPSWWTVRYHEDYTLVGELCLEVEDQKAREACFRGTGNVIAGMRDHTINEIAHYCSLMPDAESKMLCIEASTWIAFAEPRYKDTWTQLCDPYTGEYYNRCMGSGDLLLRSRDSLLP